MFYIITTKTLESKFFYKIGVTNNLKRRISDHQTSLPEDVRIAKLYQTTNDIALENVLLNKFYHYRRKGEWIQARLTDIIKHIPESYIIDDVTPVILDSMDDIEKPSTIDTAPVRETNINLSAPNIEFTNVSAPNLTSNFQSARNKLQCIQCGTYGKIVIDGKSFGKLRYKCKKRNECGDKKYCYKSYNEKIIDEMCQAVN